MTLNELLKELEMEEPSSLEYFEQLASLLEYDEPIPFDIFYSALSPTSSEELGEWLELYFDELSDSIPDAEQDLFSLADSLRQRLGLLWQSSGSEEARRTLVEELQRFQNWYTKPGGASVDGAPCSVLEALTHFRAQKLGEPPRTYDFQPSLDYPLEELSLHLGAFEPIGVDLGEEAELEE
jgi:hypothetical protein